MVHLSDISFGQDRTDRGASANDMSQIFISHIEVGQSIAQEIARGLEDAGYSVWYYERDSYPGAHYEDQVSNAIEGCEPCWFSSPLSRLRRGN